MGNIFSYCWKVKDNFGELKDNYLLKPLNDNDSNDYSYASFVDGDGDGAKALDNLNMLNRKIEILEETTQSSLKNISTDIKHIYIEQEEIKKHINSPNSSTYSNKSIDNKSIDNKSIDNKSIDNIKYEITEQSSMFVNESVYHDFNNDFNTDFNTDFNNNISSEEETY